MTVNLQPTLQGSLIELRPLREDDWGDLYAVASDPLIWEQHPASDRYQEAVFRGFFGEAMATQSAFVVVDRATRRIIGSSRYHGYNPAAREIEIGWTFLARDYWGGRYNGEMKQLMLDHAFQFVDRVIFLIGANNRRSRLAVERIGAVLLPAHPLANTERVVYGITRPQTAAATG